jgi:hypothetical protein
MDDKNIGERFLLYVCKTEIDPVRLQYAGTAGLHQLDSSRLSLT